MRLIPEEKFNKRIKNEFIYDFDILERGLYAIEVSGRAKSWLQNTLKLASFFKDDDLAVKIDGREFPKLSGKRGLFDGEAAWNGNKLKNLQQINVFFVYFDIGRHSLKFIADQSPLLETVRIYQTDSEKNVVLEPAKNYQIERGNRRPWLVFILVDLALERLKIQAGANQKYGDDEDLQLRINGERQINDTPKSHTYWYWCGRTLKGNKKIFSKELNLPKGLHYIELWADRSPQLKDLEIIFAERKVFGKIALHQDIEEADVVNVRNEPSNRDESSIIYRLKDGERIEILEERVIGEWVQFKSYIWHKIKYRDQEGYILSSFVEIDGQERQVILHKIRQKAKECNVKDNLVLALAGCESRYKPYATSKVYNPEDLKTGFGIFQLTGKLIIDFNDKTKQFYSPVSDVFDIDQNIAAGIKYFKYLYQARYRGEKNQLEKAIAAYNAGPHNVPKAASLDVSLYEEQTQKLVGCVLENLRKKNWQYIIWPILVSAVMLTVGLGIWGLDQNDFFEPTLSEKEYLAAQVSRFPAVFLERESDQIIFFNSLGKVIKKIPSRQLRLNELLRVPPDVRTWNSIHLDTEVIEAPENMFYFLAATTFSCGAQNCSWVLYRYDVKKDVLDVVATDIFGVSVGLIPSPDFSRFLIQRNVHGSACDTGSYLGILDISDGGTKEVRSFFDESYPTAYIESLSWQGSDYIKMRVYYHDCSDLSRHAYFKNFVIKI